MGSVGGEHLVELALERLATADSRQEAKMLGDPV